MECLPNQLSNFPVRGRNHDNEAETEITSGKDIVWISYMYLHTTKRHSSYTKYMYVSLKEVKIHISSKDNTEGAGMSYSPKEKISRVSVMERGFMHTEILALHIQNQCATHL